MPRDTATDFDDQAVKLLDLEDEAIDRLTARVFCAGGPDLELCPSLMRRLQAR
jgi:hypothetical protein